mmetsp:Transcript_39686/g.62757  ORF Transcript_39686/g.62757 Transcript_39686/m.62757 type:complete len:234 (-) Transcript_39686:111-812(-)|eukprot:CAMPEP_0201510770 /NCGR_PEP_ID=MMETSP0161_2-20130828/3339_1 /ASSEMBLY_ACC=CAM_ASM_000251 /TAXON_ID=180227 /ORGANISM="Neoparamoeba aestuarina, Strain SoJaBio B1-5/56/2" /LENGTH=233 /DNA_ID=CAMNT_0047906007 /DNA_START=78 /DNA_END=779 /DNA_ORIENTATION=-
MSEGKIVIGYWKIRGLAAPLRMVMVHAGVEFENKMYVVTGEPGNWDTSSWFKEDKPGLVEKNALMNLPYIIDGDIVVTQSNACFTYLGRKYNLNGKTEVEVAKNEQCLCQIMDLRNEAVGLFYSPQKVFDEKVEGYLDGTAKRHLQKFENWLAQQKTDFLAGAEPTVSDFHLYEMLLQHRDLAKAHNKDILSQGLPTLVAYFKRMAALPSIQKYHTEGYDKIPINNLMASFGN